MVDKVEEPINHGAELSGTQAEAEDVKELSEVEALFLKTPDHAKLVRDLRDDSHRVMRLFVELRDNQLGNLDTVNRAIAWMEFLNDFLLIGEHLPPPKSTPYSMAQLVDHDTLAHIAFTVMGLRMNAVKPDADNLLDQISSELGQQIKDVLDRFHKVKKGKDRDTVLSTVTALASRFETLRILDEARIARRSAEESQEEAAQAATEAKQSAVHVKEVAGEEAVGELSNHFSDYARVEQRAADVWRVVAVAVLLGSSAAALWLLHGLTTPDLNDCPPRDRLHCPLQF